MVAVLHPKSQTHQTWRAISDHYSPSTSCLRQHCEGGLNAITQTDLIMISGVN